MEKKSVTCRICGTEFDTTNPRAKYCSARCRTAAAHKSRKINVEEEPILCMHCGKQFIPILDTEVFCSIQCKREYKLAIRNRPCKPRKADTSMVCKLAHKCEYGKRLADSNQSNYFCDYIGVTGHSRVLEDRKDGRSGLARDCKHFIRKEKRK